MSPEALSNRDVSNARRLCGLVVVFVSLAASNAEGQPGAIWQTQRRGLTEQARTELQSNIPKDVAWGAYRAAQFQLGELNTELARALAAPPAAADPERFAMMSALLDAAVSQQTPVPAKVLRTLWKGWPVQTALLFPYATGDDRTAVLLDILDNSSGFEWKAAANLLAAAKAPGFAPRLLQKLRLTLSVDVSELGNKGQGGSIGGGIGVGDGIAVNPDGFPPMAWYRFE